MEADDYFGYQLRRIGSPATLENVRDIVRFDKDVVTIGRHTESDLYLDSAVLKNFISRKQADVLHAGDAYILRDYGLNGSYVNDKRVNVRQALRDGDVIKFGHTQGKNVQKGAFAPQSTKEFTFVFERASSSRSKQEKKFGSQKNPCLSHPIRPLKSILKVSDSPVPSRMKAECLANKENKEYKHSISDILRDAQTLNMCDVPSAENSIVVDSQDGVDEDSFRSSPIDEISSQLSTHLKPKMSTQRTIEFPRVPKLGLPSSPTIPLIGRNGETPTDIVNIRGYQPRRLLPVTPPVNPVLNFITASMGIPLLKSRTDFNSPSDHGRNDTPDFTTDNDEDLADLAANAVNHFDSDDDIFDAQADVAPTPATNKIPPKSKPEPGILSPQDLLKQVRAKLSSIENKLSSHNVSNSQLENSPELPQSSDSTQGHDRQTSDVNIVPFLSKQPMTSATEQLVLSASKQPLSSSFNRGNTEPFLASSQAASAGSLQQENMAVEALTTLHDSSPDFGARLSSAETLLSSNSGKIDLPAVAQPTLNNLWSTPTLSVPPPVHRSAQVQKITPEPVALPKSSRRNSKRRSTQGSADAKPKKKPARSTGSTKPSATKPKKRKKVHGEEEEDPKYFFQCDSFDCIKPDDPLITWVQCDDCDKWYHTSCVGCRYEQVQNEHTEFHCGCR